MYAVDSKLGYTQAEVILCTQRDTIEYRYHISVFSL